MDQPARLLAMLGVLLLMAGCNPSQAVVRLTPSPSATPATTASASPVPTTPTPDTFPSPIPTQGPADTLLSIRMTSLAVMQAGTSQRVLRSTDGGRQWSNVTPAGISPRSWTAFYALDDNAAWVVDSPFGTRRYVILRTVDGGHTWSAAIGAIDFESVTSGWQLDSPIQATSDGGLTWHPLAEPAAPFAASDLGLQDLGKGIAMAWSRLVAYRTDDGARTWRVITPPGLHD